MLSAGVSTAYFLAIIYTMYFRLVGGSIRKIGIQIILIIYRGLDLLSYLINIRFLSKFKQVIEYFQLSIVYFYIFMKVILFLNLRG